MSEEQDQTEDQPQEKQESAAHSDEERIIPIERARREEEAEDEGGDEPEAGDLNREEMKTILEALLFASTSPLSSRRLAELAGLKSGRTARGLITELKEDYQRLGRAFTVEEIGGGFQLMTLPEFHTWVGKLRHKEQEETLSQAALETLAIIAYRQPITRAEIEDIRGVQSGYILRSLIEKALVRVSGRSEELGRPLLYATSNKFLDAFGLGSLKDLPSLEDLEASSEGK